MLPLLLALCLALTACTDAAQPAASGTSAAQASPSASASASAQEATPAPAAEDVATLVQGASESMILVNADNPVGEGFQPPVLKSLKSLITQPVKLDDDSIQADPCVADAMNAMLSAAKADGEATMRIQNGYRSYKRQKDVYKRQDLHIPQADPAIDGAGAERIERYALGLHRAVDVAHAGL